MSAAQLLEGKRVCICVGAGRRRARRPRRRRLPWAWPRAGSRSRWSRSTRPGGWQTRWGSSSSRTSRGWSHPSACTASRCKVSCGR